MKVLPTMSVPSNAGWVRTRGGWVGQERVRSGIFEREERVGEVIEGVGDAGGPCLGDKDVGATIVEERGGDAKTSDAVMVPRLALGERMSRVPPRVVRGSE